MEKKEIDKEYLQNLDIFFRIYDMENWVNLPNNQNEKSDFITVVCDDKEYSLLSSQELPEAEKSIFDDLRRYFIACFEGTAEPIRLSYHSFDGGGPKYEMEMEVKDIFTWYSNRHYSNPDHENLCGSGYEMEFALYPLRMGQASAILNGYSPICPEPPRRIVVNIDDNLQMTYKIEEMENHEIES